jgi:hypothetical protein
MYRCSCRGTKQQMAEAIDLFLDNIGTPTGGHGAL